jgi:hypothetical protein
VQVAALEHGLVQGSEPEGPVSCGQAVSVTTAARPNSGIWYTVTPADQQYPAPASPAEHRSITVAGGHCGAPYPGASSPG